MKNITLTMATLYQGIIGFLSPYWIGFIYLFITGHSKGYAYDLGSDKDISIMLGFVLLILWILALFPISIWLGKTLYHLHKRLLIIPILLFAIFFGIGLKILGVDEFLGSFGIGSKT